MTDSTCAGRLRSRLTPATEALECRQLMAAPTFGFNNNFTIASAQSGSAIVSIDEQTSSGSTTPSTPATALYLTLSGGDATPGVDYTPGTQTIAFAANQTGQTVLVPILPGSVSEGTKYVEMFLSTTPGGAPVASAYLEITHTADITPPTVTSTKAIIKAGDIKAFVITFSKPMAPGPVGDVSNYAIDDPRSVRVNKAAEATYATRTLRIKSAVYDSATHSVTLTLGGKVPKFPFFIVDGSQADAALNSEIRDYRPNAVIASTVGANVISPITDTTGNLLDSTNSGTPDGQLVAVATIGKAGKALLKSS